MTTATSVAAIDSDIVATDEIRAALLAFKERGTTIVVVTHRTTMLEVVDALMVLRAGELEMIGPPDAVYDHLKKSATEKVAQASA